MHGHGHRLHRPLHRLLDPTTAGVDEGRVVDTLPDYDDWDEDATYDHFDLDLG